MTVEREAPRSPEVRDSRRLTGPNLLWDLPGAVLDVACAEEAADRLVDAWRVRARERLDAVGWDAEQMVHRRFPGGANLALSAPIDCLYAATEVNESAFAAAVADVAGGSAAETAEDAAALCQVIARERNPALLRLRDAADAHRVAFLSDDEQVSVGLGRGSVTFPAVDLPDPDGIDWSRVHDVPVALITGTNGKSTTVRLVAAMARAAGEVPGVTSTDGIFMGDELVDRGDYSGPSGARAVLRDRRAGLAILETARGGMLRRGLGVRRADVALVTNVGRDHLGEFGVSDHDSLVEAKLIVRRAVGPEACLALNADDEELRGRGEGAGVPVAWFTAGRPDAGVRRHIEDGGEACVERDGMLILYGAGRRQPVASVDAIPITVGGAARFNVSNALGAILVGRRLGLDLEAVAAGLEGFDGGPRANPGRGNLFELGGMRALVDFAHNPHACRALFQMAAALEPARTLVLLGQAGDRDDASIRELAEVAWEARPDRIILKEMDVYLRGRQPGEVSSLMEAELRRLGAPETAVERVGSELEGVRRALGWARRGDLLLLLSHADRTAVLELLGRMARGGWQPGQAVPS